MFNRSKVVDKGVKEWRLESKVGEKRREVMSNLRKAYSLKGFQLPTIPKTGIFKALSFVKQMSFTRLF